MVEYRKCQECGRELPLGARSDMKFCCEKCKSRWHYRDYGWRKGYRMKVLRSIERNYAILQDLVSSGTASMNIPDLVQRGYDFDCITSYHKVRNHNEYRCFDIKYFMSSNRIFQISRIDSPIPLSGLRPQD